MKSGPRVKPAGRKRNANRNESSAQAYWPLMKPAIFQPPPSLE